MAGACRLNLSGLPAKNQVPHDAGRLAKERANEPKNPMNKDSFWSSLKELDIIPQDRVLFPNGKRPSKSVKIFQSDVAKGFHNAGYKKLPDDLDNECCQPAGMVHLALVA